MLKATPLGFNLIDAVPSSIKDPLLTAQWEQQLDDIANNKGQNNNGFLKQQIDLLKSIVIQVKAPKINNRIQATAINKSADRGLSKLSKQVIHVLIVVFIIGHNVNKIRNFYMMA